MDMDRANRWLTFVANLGVLAGILFLAVEIQQSNRIAIASTEIDVRNSFASINESIYSNPNLADLFIKAGEADANLTPAEEWRVYALVLRLLNTWLAIETAYTNGMVPHATFSALENDMRGMMNRFPKMRSQFRLAIETYPALSETDIFRNLDRILGEYEQ